MALPANNTFEGGSADEAAVTTGNSGGASGSAFDNVILDTGNTVVFDRDKSMHGQYSARFDIPTTSRAAVGWDNPTTGGGITEAWGRCYLFSDGTFPAVSTRLIGIFNSAGQRCGSVEITSGLLLRVIDFDSNANDTVASVPAASWTRIEFHILCSTTIGLLEARMFAGDSLTPITNGTVSSPATRNTLSNCEEFDFGNTNFVAATRKFWLDDLNVNTSGWPGPSVSQVGQYVANIAGRGAGW